MHGSLFTKWQNVLGAGARQPALHQARCSLGNDNLLVWRNVVAVPMGNKSAAFCIPRVEPQILLRQINPALITNANHGENLGAKRGEPNLLHHFVPFAYGLIRLV